MLPFLNYLTNHHQSRWGCYETDVEQIPNIENYANSKIEDGGCRRLGFRKKYCDFLTI
jgi:hypothetical protein